MLTGIATPFAAMLAIVFGVLCHVTVNAAERLGSYAVNPDAISISGISSGGFMANQIHTAHSAQFMGVGIIAGGPYQCASVNSGLGDFFGSYKELWNAVYVCSRQASQTPLIGFLQPFLGPPDPSKSVAAARAEANSGTIDALENMRGDRIWLFSGTEDTLIPPSVVAATGDYYTEILATLTDASEDRIAYVNDVDVHHAMVVAKPGDNNCLDFELPYINDCDYDAAGELLSFIYQNPETVLKEPVEWERQSLIAFDQTEFFPESTGSVENESGSISMNDVGHVYVPAKCRDGAQCRLHVALHGCEQYQENVESQCVRDGKCPPLLFFEAAGYNEWAEANDTIVLYPQTTVWNGPSITRTNPKGCWDWWGFSGEAFATKDGKQVRAIKSMVDRLTAPRDDTGS